ncbi:hypothetical protein HPB52_014864 [Rhipicephalus sanguineus]|uniref:G-protein coupled receptors family 1 profile domain-containing protein n=1 Tax=Rhipicephalus sanguineus TaxID=34632 RepID=A0A9D4SQC6_RHISA|nr:hypothetical protein HPB52_014864 [Rhipicephalus sanguineus]
MIVPSPKRPASGTPLDNTTQDAQHTHRMVHDPQIMHPSLHRTASSPNDSVTTQSPDNVSRILHYTNIMDTVVTLIVPFILIVIMNFMIGRALYLFNARRRLQRINSAQMDSVDPDNRNISSGCSPTASHKAIPTTVSANGCTQVHHQYPERLLISPSQISVSRMLFLVCTVFIILNLPSYVVRIHVFVLSISNQPVPDYILLLQRYFMLLYYTNFAVNFILYNLGSRIFRRMMKQYVASKWRTVSSLCRSTESYESSAGVGDAVAGSLKPHHNEQPHCAAARHKSPRKT